MLYVSLVPAFLVLLAAKYSARPAPEGVRWGLFVPAGLGAFGVPVVMLMFFPVVIWLTGLLFVALLLWPLARERVRSFWPLGITAALVAYGTVSWSAYRQQREQNRLREEYAFVSMAARVPEPRAEGRLVNPDGVAWFVKHEDELRDGYGWRASTLRRLHEDTTDAFVNSDGFGIARMPGAITASQVKPSENWAVPPQPGSPVIWPHGEAFEVSPAPERAPLAALHLSGLSDFAYRDGWGYRKDRDRVAGFLSHRFSRVPQMPTWTVHRIELVGLLKHAEPKVYLSDKLPAMDDLRDAPTRAPDAFETAGLEVIRKGEEGFAAQRPDVMRYLGAIRSAKQCVECHGGQRGDLLGAFAYTLRR
jgi:hypothetical protein